MIRLIALATALTGAVLAVILYLDLDAGLLRLLEGIEDSRGAALVFVAIMALAVVLLLPGFPLTAGAGLLFGVGPGTAYVVIGTTIGSACAFLIARHCLGSRAQRWLAGHARARILSEEIAGQGWRIVLLTRLIPFFPGKASNYAFGLTRVGLGGFVLGTFVGIIPFSLHNAYLGSLAGDLLALNELPRARGPLEWTFLIGGLFLLAGGLALLGRFARRALARAQVEQT